MKKPSFFLMLFFALSACSGKVIDVKSPCVSTEDGPCGPKRPVNDWWIKGTPNSKNTNS